VEVARHEADLVSMIYGLIWANQRRKVQQDRFGKVTEIAGPFREKRIARERWRRSTRAAGARSEDSPSRAPCPRTRSREPDVALSVSIVIPAKNGRPTIGPSLDAVLAQDYDGPLDVLVVDSGSTDGTLDDVRARPAVKLHRIHPLAFDHGDTRNLGAGMTTGEAIVFLVQDAEPVGKHWLKNLVRNLDDPSVAGAFSRVLPRPDAGPLVKKGCEGDLNFGSRRIESRMSNPAAWHAQDPHSLRVACNFNDVASVLRRSVWRTLPMQHGMFGEDIKFARAAIEAGWTIVFDPESQVLHSHEYDASTLYDRTYIDAVLNMEYLKRACVDTFKNSLVLTGRFVKADWRFLKEQGLPFGQRLKWGTRSPYYHFKEFYGFWRGGKDAAARGRYPAPAAPSPDRPLKILTVVHGFPPESWAGTEVVSLTLARALRARGHGISFFVRSPGKPGVTDCSVFREDFDGFRVHRFVNHLRFGGVDETYRFAPAEDAFDRVLQKEKPDVVHLQHMIHLSTGLVDRCRAAGVPCVVSLSDFWTRCSRVRLIRPDRKNCTIAPPGVGCAACVKEKPGLIGPLAALDHALGRLVDRWAGKVPQSVPAPPPGWKKTREDAASLVRRESWMCDVLRRADCVTVNSATTKTAIMGFGLSHEEVVLSEPCLDTRWLKGGRPKKTPRARGEPLRVGFIGSLIWYKGLDVLCRAVAGLPAGSAKIHVHGDHLGGSNPAAAAELRQVAEEALALGDDGIVFHGRYDHDDLASIHAGLDVVVVPSVWQEPFGLVVREAQLAGTPVVGSDVAGIAESIEHEVSGLLFRTGDAGALRSALQRFVDDPGLAARLAAGAPRVKTDVEGAIESEWRYRQVISAKGSKP
jgi:glycosyltransferase involved in cell wall biosynthesis